jgi:outer membrane protein assembly factor BamB
MPTSTRLVFTGLAIALTAATPRAQDWNAGTGGNPQRNGLSTWRGPLAPEILWEGGLPAVVAQPAVTEGGTAAMSRMGNINDVLHGTRIVACELDSGDTLWTGELPVDFPQSDWRSRVSAIRDGRIYATRSGNDNNSFLYALDAATGEQLWRSQDSLGESSTESPAFAEDGDLIVGSLFNVERVNAEDGTRVWRAPRLSPTSNGNEVAVFGGRGYHWQQTGQGPAVRAIDLESGDELYTGPGLGGLVQQVGLFVGPDGTVYAPRTQNNAITDYLVAYDDNGSALVERWRVPLGYTPFGTFGVGPDGSVYSYAPDNRVIRIEPQTGAVLDSSEVIVTDFLQPRMAIGADGIVYLTNGGFSQGALYSFDADLSTRWILPVNNVNIGGPAIGLDGTLIVCGTGDDVRAFRGEGSNAVGDDPGLAARSPSLEQNSPNPFNPSTTIAFELPRAGWTTVRVHNVSGQLVATLVDGRLEAGRHTVAFDGRGLPSGVYVCALDSGALSESRAMILLK